MQKFNKAFAPSTAKPGLRRQEEAAGERRKEREACDGVQRAKVGGAGPSTEVKALMASSCPRPCCRSQEVSMAFG